MAGLAQLDRIRANLLALGTQRLAALSLIVVATLAAVAGSAWYLSRPAQAVLYSGLAAEDVSRIGSALTEAGIAFDVSADGATVLVSTGSTARARMFLAERGLPQGGTAGYELFDHMDGLGLTSFMQELTRGRALEGELARTIQTLNGVKAARVHLVLPERGTFRTDRQPPSASVVVRGDGLEAGDATRAIRLLVSAAVPGLTPDRVTVLDTAGRTISSGADTVGSGNAEMADLERTVAARLTENLRRTLTPHLGIDNFQLSVTPMLNTDRQRIAETTYDPESRVERSVRTVRENENASNADSAGTAVTVQSNLPNPPQTGPGDRSTEETARREELVNYEIASRITETTRDGYDVRRLAIAVVVNRQRLAEAAALEGGRTVEAQIADLEAIAATAVGLDQARGDRLTVTAVDFLTPEEQMTPFEPISVLEVINRHLGDVIKALVVLVMTLMLIWFGLRPAVATLVPRPQPLALSADGSDAADGVEGGAAAAAALAGGADAAHLLEDLATRPNRDRLHRLEATILADEEQAMIVLKQWLHKWGPTYAGNSSG